MPFVTIDPSTGVWLKSFDEEDDEQIARRLELARLAFRSWRRTPFSERAARLVRVAEILEAKRDGFARLMAIEMGKPLGAGRDEVTKCAAGARFYAENAAALLSDETIAFDGARVFIRYQPLGVVLAVMPWNFPFWQVLRFAAPALAAGNVCVLKHASNVPQCGLALQELFMEAGFPAHVFQAFLLGSDRVENLIEDPRIAAVTLTGSEAAGRKVASAAGRQIKKTVLELGGSDPFIVMPSADLGEAVAAAVKARTVNSGQSCIAAKRFLVHEKIYRAFSERFVAQMAGLKVGPPLDAGTEVGPLATAQILETLENQVARGVEAGGRVLTRGRRLDPPGFFYPPTVLADLPVDAPVVSEEFFGPVALLFQVGNIEQAIELANATDFGLGSSVWTEEPAEADRFVEEIEAGQVFVNGIVASDPRLPFGGVKRSGYGRELGDVGIREFVNVKLVWIRA